MENTEEIVLCAASAYEQKFYLNPDFMTLPESIRQELQIMCVLYTADVGGILMVVYDEDGNLELKVEHDENDFEFDEIGSVLKIKELQNTKRELFESLELYYRVKYLGEDIDLDDVEDSEEQVKGNYMKQLTIGNVTLDNCYVLGPMAGVTDLPFRLLCREQGAGLLCMEMISAKGIL